MTPPLANLAFLVVDDNEHMVRIVKTVLKGFGVGVVHEARDAPTAFAICRSSTVDLALVDVNLGIMDGLAFVRLMRTAADSPNPYLPILMVSAYSELYRVEAAREAGAHDFLVKPFSPAELHRKIMDCVEHPRLFIRSDDFQGPDRRRRKDADYRGPERRAAVAPDAPGPVEGSSQGAFGEEASSAA